MVLEPGDSEGGPTNRHKGADQWLFVLSGTGTARINRRRYPLHKNSLLLIERGDYSGAALYVAGSALLSILALFAGLWLVRWI
jgi:uncharacterized cupin superfamily protein